MRPRVFPAEDETLMEYEVVMNRASMRPRVFPAEDVILEGNTVYIYEELQ